MKFLHISDIHLGCTRYHLEESQRDFFDAWFDVIQKFGIAEEVDFVIMSGDFFHKRSVPPETMNYAFAGLTLLKEKGIPVISIEGNHDQKHNDSDFSWLRSLQSWRLLHLLEPKITEGEMIFERWDYERGSKVCGGFIDIGNARIFGSDWYGASANKAIPKLTEAIEKNQRDGAFHILLLHTDVEGHQTHPIPALTIENLKKLKSVTNYVALGHTHKCYEIENWAFNPGSLEITKIDEFREIRGAWLVEVGENLEVNARHVRDYTQRPFRRLSFDVDKCVDGKELTEKVLQKVENEVTKHEENSASPQPIIEIKLLGHLGFPNSTLELDKIRRQAREMTNALHVMIKNHSVPVEYAVAADVDEDISREKLERRVIEDLIFRDNRYKTRSEEVTEAVVGAKRMALNDEPPEKIVDFIALKTVENEE